MSVQYVATRPADGKQSVVGIVGVLMAMVLLVAMVGAAGIGGQESALAVKAAGHTGNLVHDPAADPHETRYAICLIIMLAIWIASLAPFVLGIIGSRRRPRNMGITAIGVSVLTPIIGFIILMCFALPVYMRYPS